MVICLSLIVALLSGSGAVDHQHDFDFEFGHWHTVLKRLVHPLSGSHQWTTYSGTSSIRGLWGGRGNVGEFDVRGSAGHILGSSIRIYNPQTHLWNIYWANADGSPIGTPMIGNFHDGRGEFYDRETFDGRPIRVRFVFSGSMKNTFQLEQAFSADDGKTWEANWIAEFTRDR